MSRKKISTTIYVTPEQSDRLKVLHERTKVPVAVYIREGIDLVLRQYAHLLPGQLPLVQSPSAEDGRSREARARRQAEPSNRELPGMERGLESGFESAHAEDGELDSDDEHRSGARGERAPTPAEAQTGLDKVAAGAKK